VSAPRSHGVTLTWLGHATVLVETAGARVLTDPVLRARVAHLWRRTPNPPDPGPLDGVLISHLHHDHLDKPSLRRVATERTTAVLPRGAANLLDGMGFGSVREVTAGDTVQLGETTIKVVPAWHDGRRRPGSPERETLGFLIDAVWFAGDTDLNDSMRALHGEVDVALIPIWGWGRSLGPGHLDPEGAAKAVALVEPRIVIPIHWGTFLPIGVRRGELLTSPPRDFARYVAELAPTTRVETLAPGASLTLE
jgi:L-ascorbate metabolism protein UlaG (beta-lactamase superfamily)